jgi:DNA-binding NarL/FixJ family response regulator
MRERAESVDGSLVVRSTPGQGTEVIVRLPLVLEQEINEAVRGLRVLLVDDHPLYLEGLRNMLRARGVHVVGMAQDGIEAQKLAKTLHPDLILMDVDMPRMGGLEATRAIKAALPDIKIVMLTVAAEEETLFDALKDGASGYLLKSLNRRKFFALLSEVMRGETVLSPALAARILAEFSQHKPEQLPAEPDAQAEVVEAGSFTDLTERQQEVLDLLVQNLSNKEIAARLYVTEQTVKYHVGQILKRLQLRSRYELTHYIQEQGSSLQLGSDLPREP